MKWWTFLIKIKEKKELQFKIKNIQKYHEQKIIKINWGH